MPLSGSAFFACVLPVAKTNLLANSSGERGTFGWGTALVSGGGTVGTTSAFQQFGAWAGSCAPTGNASQGGARLGTWTSGNGTDYTASVYIRGGVGSAYALRVASNDESGVLGATSLTTGGTWHRYTVAYTENSDTTRVLTIGRNGAGADAFYFDGAQVEVGDLTTYVDGDQDGCLWLGAPHQSQSLRSGTYRGGGSVVALADLGLRPDQYPGVGVPPMEITSQSYALQAGAEYQRSRAGERPFTITFKPILGTTQKDFHVTRRRIIDAFKPDLVDPQQPIRFWYTGGLGTVQIDAVYHSGLDFGDMNGPMAEEGAIRFVAPDPMWYAPTQEGTSLAPRSNIGSTNYLAWRDPRGQWGTMGVNGSTVQLTGAAARVNTLLHMNGTLIFGGRFGTAGGTISPAIGLYRPTTNTFGTLVGGTVTDNGIVASTLVQALARGADNAVYVAGVFGTAAGTRATSIARWTGAAWGTLVGGTLSQSPDVRSLAFSGGTLVVAGDFGTAGGTISPRIALWRNNAWGTLTGGTLDNSVESVTIGKDRKVYVGGNFGSAGGTATIRFAFWGGAWGTPGGQLGDDGGPIVFSVAAAPSGDIYAGGIFGTLAGGTGYNIARYNGQQLFNLGSGVQNSTGLRSVNTMLVDQQTGNVLVGGRFGTAGALTLSDGLALWNGYAWTSPDIQIDPQSGTFYALTQSVDGTIYAGGNFTGTANAASVAQVVNTGRSEAYPIFKARNFGASGTARLWRLSNPTTGDTLYFDYVIQAGEEVTLVTEPGARAFTSDFSGNIFDRITPGSNLSSFRLLSGVNTIALFCDSGSVAASIYWQPRSWSADAGTTY